MTRRDATRAASDDSGETEEPVGTTGLFSAWERSTRQWALVCAALTLAVSALVGVAVIRSGERTGTTLVLALAPAVAVYFWQTRVVRRRRAILRESFPPE